MEPTEIVTQYWERTQARDWAGVEALLAPGVVVEWPVSGERFSGREPFVAMNRGYPEGWSIEVRRIVREGATVVSEVAVPHEEYGLSVAVSLWTVEGDAIVAGREYWVSPGSEQPPAWRSAFTTRYDPTMPTVPTAGAAPGSP